jgi:hypothetical protein
MPIEPPPIRSQVSVLLDWFEIAVLATTINRLPLSEIKSQLDLQQDEEPDDWSEKDELLEDLQTKLCAKVLERSKALGQHYPYFVSDDGGYFHFREDMTLGGTIYLFCLFICQANGSEVLSGEAIPKLTNEDRDLFQICATLCAAGFCHGPAISFGWPRPDRSGLLPKLRELEGPLVCKVRTEALAGTGTHVKDDEIDVIAWRQEPDGRIPTLYLLGQAASGRNWESKSIRTAIDHVFHRTWFAAPPATPPIPAIFIPFAPDEFDGTPVGFDSESSAAEWQKTNKLGSIHTRYRLPRYAADATRLAEIGIKPIERLDEIERLEKWVVERRDRLKQEWPE